MRRLEHRLGALPRAAGFWGLCAPSAQAAERNTLPLPDPPFQGKIGLRASDSVKDFPAEATAPEGAPNVLLILTDDVGFGATSTFGGPIPTPTFDRIANMGLRFNNFHTTALCSPTRAALVSGRNHHSVATGGIMEIGVGYPGYNTLIPQSKRGMGDILKLNDRYLPMRANIEQVSQALNVLLGDLVGTRDNFYFLLGREQIVDIRRQREAHSQQLLKQALRYGRILALCHLSAWSR